MKGKNEKHDLNNQHRDIEKFEDTLFRVLATMDRDLLQALIDDFGLEACDRDGRNILMNLILEHGDELCLYLLNEHEVDVNATDLSGFAALHFATIEDNYDLMAKLLSLGAHVNAQDKDGNTPLFYAFRYRVSAAAINLLLDHGAAPMIENKHGVRPIDLSGN